MIALYKDLPDGIEYKGQQYPVNLAFDRILACLDIQADARVSDEDRLPWIAELLGLPVKKLPLRDMAIMVEAVFREYVWFQHRGATSRTEHGPAVRTFDFRLDADIIYAAFLQAYGLDLYKERGRLHWWKFCSLFYGLPKDTKMREVMAIRARELPAPTKYNQEEIRNLRLLKQMYALPGAGGPSYGEGLKMLWNTLKEQASKS